MGSSPRRTVSKNEIIDVAIEYASTVYIPKKYIVPLDNISSVAFAKLNLVSDFPVFGTNSGKNKSRFNRWNAERSSQLASLEKRDIAIRQKVVKDNSDMEIAKIIEKSKIKIAKKICKKLRKINNFISKFKKYLKSIRLKIINKKKMIIKARRVSKKLMVIGDFIFKFKIYIQFIRFKIIRRKAKKKKKIMMKELKLKCNDIMENNI